MPITLNKDIIYSPIFEDENACRSYLYLKYLQSIQDTHTELIDTGNEIINISLYENEVVVIADDSGNFFDLRPIISYDINIIDSLRKYGVAVCVERHDLYLKFRLLMGY